MRRPRRALLAPLPTAVRRGSNTPAPLSLISIQLPRPNSLTKSISSVSSSAVQFSRCKRKGSATVCSLWPTACKSTPGGTASSGAPGDGACHPLGPPARAPAQLQRAGLAVALAAWRASAAPVARAAGSLQAPSQAWGAAAGRRWARQHSLGCHQQNMSTSHRLSAPAPLGFRSTACAAQEAHHPLLLQRRQRAGASPAVGPGRPAAPDRPAPHPGPATLPPLYSKWHSGR